MELGLVFLVLFYVLNKYVNQSAAKNGLNIKYEWSQIEFEFASKEERKEAINNGTFKVGRIQPIDVQAYYPDDNGIREVVMITCPRISDGIPVTLGTITNQNRNGNPIVKPYPTWEYHTNPEICKKHRIVSVYRTFIDDCHRLWVADNGRIGDVQVCPPQIMAFDLRTNSLMHQYEIPFDQHLNTSVYHTPVVEQCSKNCEDSVVYVADSDGYSLLVYDLKNNKSWRIFDKTFNPNPKYEEFNIAGTSFKVLDGLLGVALSPYGSERKLFYHAMSSDTENWVYTKHLKNQSLFSGSNAHQLQIFNTYSKGRGTQSSAEAMDSSGNLYFGLLGKTEIASWNIKKSYGLNHFHIIGKDKKTMQFPSGIKVISDKSGEEHLWVFASAFQRTFTNTLDPNEINFIILHAKVRDLLD